MTYPAHESDGQISGVHSMALRQEIAERLGADLDRKPIGMPPRLTMLMNRLRDEPCRIRLEPDR
jgi:hypothetical protein